MLIPATAIPALRNEQARQAQRYARWHIAGPPCAALGQRFGAPLLDQNFRVAGVRVSREHGTAVCETIRDDGGRGPMVVACHFISPGLVVVAAANRSAAFDPGVGSNAAIFVGRSSISCVRASNLDLFSDANDRPYD